MYCGKFSINCWVWLITGGKSVTAKTVNDASNTVNTSKVAVIRLWPGSLRSVQATGGFIASARAKAVTIQVRTVLETYMAYNTRRKAVVTVKTFRIVRVEIFTGDPIKLLLLRSL